MAFYRFESMDQITPNPHLSSGTGAIIKGTYLTLRNNNKKAGTGSELHYHPNELVVFSLEGRLNCVVGKDRRIVLPGTLVHMPPMARHSIKATEDGAVSYLYVKDNTWDLTGFAADEELSDEAKQAGNGHAADGAVIEGLDECYYNVIDGLGAPASSFTRQLGFAGERISFAFHEAPAGFRDGQGAAARERFAYVIGGQFDAMVDNEKKSIGPGDIVHVPKGAPFELTVVEGPARWTEFEPTPALEAAIGN